VREQTVEGDGDKITKARSVWTEKRRRGVAAVRLGGQGFALPFAFPEGANLKVEKIP
jgi:hypothetical protein